MNKKHLFVNSKALLTKLFNAKHLSSHNSDAAKCQYEDFLTTTVKENENDFMEYNFLDKNSRLDKFLGVYLHKNKKFQSLWEVCVYVFTGRLNSITVIVSHCDTIQG